MKVIFFLIISAAGLVSQSLPMYSSDSGGFRVYQPGEWEEKWQKLTTSMGEVEVFSFFFNPADSLHDPNGLYLLNYLDYPDDVFEESDDLEDLIQMLFDESLNGTIESLDGKLQYSEPISLYGFPGRLSRIEYQEGEGVVKSKMFIADHRFYYLQVYTSKNRSLNKKMDQFLDSFVILIEE